MIKTVLFDVDGVLLDSFEANLNFFQKLMPIVGYPSPTRDQYKQCFHLSMLDVIKKLIAPASEEKAKEIFDIGRKEAINYQYQLIKTPIKITETILDLHDKYKLGIVTSRIKGRLLDYPQFKDIKNCFQTAIYYEDTKNHKPDPEPLLLAAKKLKVKSTEAVYIGDTESDRQAAQAAKMHFIHYVNNNLSDSIKTCAFTQIPNLIKNIG